MSRQSERGDRNRATRPIGGEPSSAEAGSRAAQPANSGPARWGLRWRGLFLAAVCLTALPVVNWLQFGRQDTERVVTELLLPFGLIWMVLTVLAVSSLLRWRELIQLEGAGERCSPARIWLWAIPVLWLALTVIGNRWVERWAVNMTEAPIDNAWKESLPFDYVVVLGGGIGSDIVGEPMLFEDGDRIRPALQLWVAGQTKKLVVTGTAGRPGVASPHEVTAELLGSFGVPREAIIPIEGRNTAEEMRSLKEYVEANLTASSEPQIEGIRIGLVTSAFHMPRAQRLAAGEGLKVIPIPTASRLDAQPLGFARSVIPAAGAIDSLGRCWKEWLAALLGR